MLSMFHAFGRRLTEKLKGLAPIVVGAVVLFALLWGISHLVEPALPSGWQETLDLLGSGDFEEAREQLVELLDRGPVRPEFAFVGLQVLQVVVAPIPGQLVGLLGGYLFGFSIGLLLSMGGLTVGTIIAISLARLFGEGVVRGLVPEQHLERFDTLAEQGGLWDFFLIFLLPVVPDDAACFLGGLTRLSIWKLVGVAIVGRLPGMAVLVYVGMRAGEAGQVPYVVLGIAILLALVVWLFSDEVEAWAEQYVARESTKG